VGAAEATLAAGPLMAAAGELPSAAALLDLP